MDGGCVDLHERLPTHTFSYSPKKASPADWLAHGVRIMLSMQVSMVSLYCKGAQTYLHRRCRGCSVNSHNVNYLLCIAYKEEILHDSKLTMPV